MNYMVYARVAGRAALVWQTDDRDEACRFARSMAGYVLSASGVCVFGSLHSAPRRITK